MNEHEHGTRAAPQLDLATTTIEIGYLETVVPVFRVAQRALDVHGPTGEVGRSAALRGDRDAESISLHAGARDHDERPISAAEIEALRTHWKPLRAVILDVRAALQARLGIPADRWTLGQLHLLACTVLALPAFRLAKDASSRAQPPLHPALRSLIRITDNLRATAYERMCSIDPPHAADELPTADELLAHAEQRGGFGGETGAAAGQRRVVRDVLASFVDGVVPDGSGDAALAFDAHSLVSELPAAIDYGLRGMLAWSLARSAWLAMSRAYQVLLAVLEVAPSTGDDSWAHLHARLSRDGTAPAELQSASGHDTRARAVADAYAQAWRALRSPVGQPRLAQQIALGPELAMHRAAANQLRAIFRGRSSSPPGGPAEAPLAARSPLFSERIVDALVHHLRIEQAILASITAVQEAINTGLGRPRPKRSLSVRDLGVSPYVFDSLESVLGIRVHATADAIAVADRRPNPAGPSATCCASIAAGGL